ncbi:hypothetical protein A9Q99_21490 [Gammaproteobacteria bacterium 45_16_T64]|nr:hypothetical protein A9Q99_21490 [Gammaproteobacteria bacterium 45_16_T64]
MKLKLLASLCSAFVVSCSTSDPINTSKPDVLLEYLNQNVSSKVLGDIVSDQPQWFSILDHIESGVKNGDVVWLNIAAKLRSVSDAGGSLSLDFSVARGLPYEPELVLSGVDLGFSLNRLCTIPFIEEEQSVVDAFIAEATTKLDELAVNGNGKAAECTKLMTKVHTD